MSQSFQYNQPKRTQFSKRQPTEHLMKRKTCTDKSQVTVAIYSVLQWQRLRSSYWIGPFSIWSVLSLRPDGSYVRLWLRGWSVLSAVVSAGRNGSVVSVCFCWWKGACCRNRWSCAAGWVGPCLCKVATGGGRQRTGLWVYGGYGVFVMCWSKLSSLSILSQASEQKQSGALYTWAHSTATASSYFFFYSNIKSANEIYSIGA